MGNKECYANSKSIKQNGDTGEGDAKSKTKPYFPCRNFSNEAEKNDAQSGS